MALDLENERKYLQGRMSMSQNNPGLADWVQSRSKELGISLQAPSAGAQPGAASGGAPNNYMADIAQALQAYKASGLLGNRGNVSVTPYTPRPTNIPNRQQLTTQAQGEVNPWMQRQTESTNRLYEDLRNRLPALLNARGQATGGLRNAKEEQLTKEQRVALGDVNLQAQERVAQLVNALQQRAEENAYRQQQSDYQQYLGGQQLGLQAAGMNQQGQQNELANLLGFAKFGRGVTESDRSFGLAERQALFGEQFAEKEFAYKQARDSIADERYKEEFDFNVKKWGLEVALDEAYKSGQLDISRTNAETSQGQLQETIRSNKADEAGERAKLDLQAKESETKLANLNSLNQGQRTRVSSHMSRIKEAFGDPELTLDEVLAGLESDRQVITMEFGDPSIVELLKKYAEEVAPTASKAKRSSAYLPNATLAPRVRR